MYILEGNIGVGKSTFLQFVNKNAPEIAILQEPKDNWASHVDGESLLSNFYKDPQRWAYTIETLAMTTRVKDHIQAQRDIQSYYLMERSVYSGHYCFAYNDNAQGYLMGLEWEIYLRWVDFLVNKTCKPPHGFIYLRADPSVCFERVKRRARVGEEGISFEYMQQMHNWHDKFLLEKQNIAQNLHNVPVLVLDANYDHRSDQQTFIEYVDQVKLFMQKINT